MPSEIIIDLVFEPEDCLCEGCQEGITEDRARKMKLSRPMRGRGEAMGSDYAKITDDGLEFLHRRIWNRLCVCNEAGIECTHDKELYAISAEITKRHAARRDSDGEAYGGRYDT